MYAQHFIHFIVCENNDRDKDRDISLIRRGRLYNSCVRSETWPVRKENEVALQRAELNV